MTLPNNEFRAILNHVVGRYVRLEECTEEQRARIDDLVKQRLTGMPLAKIIGSKEFWKHHFITTKDTLDPRPDSETLIEAVLKICPRAPYRILDLGTGTGCLLISLLEEYPEATGVGVDISEKALEVARRNTVVILDKASPLYDSVIPEGCEAVYPGPQATSRTKKNYPFEPCIFLDYPSERRSRTDCFTAFRDDTVIGGRRIAEDDGISTKRYNFIQSNWCENLSGTFDIIVCNPPYIDLSEPINDGATFDPPLALYGGIHTYEAILQSIDKHLTGRPKHLFFEIGYTQAADVSALLKRYGYCNIQVFQDLSGHDRVIHCCA